MALDLETRQQLIETVRRFVNEVCRPNEQLVSETNAIPDRIVQEMRDLGLFGLSISEEYGGLGLTLAQTFVSQHHGTIEFDSAPGRTCFSVTLPLGEDAGTAPRGEPVGPSHLSHSFHSIAAK